MSNKKHKMEYDEKNLINIVTIPVLKLILSFVNVTDLSINSLLVNKLWNRLIEDNLDYMIFWCYQQYHKNAGPDAGPLVRGSHIKLLRLSPPSKGCVVLDAKDALIIARDIIANKAAFQPIFNELNKKYQNMGSSARWTIPLVPAMTSGYGIAPTTGELLCQPEIVKLAHKLGIGKLYHINHRATFYSVIRIPDSPTGNCMLIWEFSEERNRLAQFILNSNQFRQKLFKVMARDGRNTQCVHEKINKLVQLVLNLNLEEYRYGG